MCDVLQAWTAYNAKMNKQLETAYSKGFKQYTMTLGDKQYIVKRGARPRPSSGLSPFRPRFSQVQHNDAVSCRRQEPPKTSEA